jgi:hypothetical protein
VRRARSQTQPGSAAQRETDGIYRSAAFGGVMIETLASLFAVIGGLYAFWHWLTKKTANSTPVEPQQQVKSQSSEVYSLVERFVQIYRAHGIERTQIPRFLGEESGLTLADVSTDEKLLNSLNENLLQTTCDRFGVQREWLDGKDVPIYPYLGHSHDLSSYIDFLLELKKSGAMIQGFAIKRPGDKLKKPKHIHGDIDRYFIALLFRVEIGHWGDHSQDSIWKYYPLGDQIYWGYKKTRMQLKAKVLIASMLGIYFKGCVMEAHEIEGIMDGSIFPGPLMEHRSHVGWHPDDYIFTEEESRAVADAEEALEVREWHQGNGWRQRLEEIVGPIEENTPFRDGRMNQKFFDRKEMQAGEI